MRIAYFDCFAGASGNMILGSLVDAGLNIDALQRELRRIPVHGWSMRAQRVHKQGLAALYLDVDVPGEDQQHGGDHHHGAGDHHHEGIAHRRLRDVLAILRDARLPKHIEASAEKIYRRLAHAEAQVHSSSVEEVLFHEVGQVDAIIDIAGAVIGLDLLGVEAVYASALPCGTGRIESAHGVMPSPAPATLELLRGVPTYQLDLAAELVTPTGAAILTQLASFAQRPLMRIENIGYGSGRSEFPFPNVLRVLIGETIEASKDVGLADATPSNHQTHVVQLEANIDDMNPQLYESVIERLFAAGALDVWLQPISMKKGRPGMLLSILSAPERADAVAMTVLTHTTTIGVRRWSAARDVQPRSIEVVQTALGPVRVKVVQGPGGQRARPEYDDCQRIASQRQLALVDVMRDVEREVADWLHSQKRT